MNRVEGRSEYFKECKMRSFLHILWIFRVSLCGIVNQLINFSVTGFCKN